jgi:cyclopropane-fatty-acyl-phospholipid synthase
MHRRAFRLPGKSRPDEKEHQLRWAETFESKLPEVRALGFDETFIRKWRYYLRYCEAAFGTRHITVAQMAYSRPDNLSIPSPIYKLGN